MRGKRRMGGLLFAVLAVAMLGGCGGNTAGDKSSAGNASGSAVSGQVGEDTVDRESGDVFFANRTNVYLEKRGNLDQDYEPIGFDQYTKDGKQAAKVRIKNFAALLAVTDEAVYYAKSMEKKDNGPQIICRIPIEKNEDGKDRVCPEKEEELLREKYALRLDSPMYVEDPYFVYATYDYDEEEDAGLIIYNQKTKKRVAAIKGQNRIMGHSDGNLYVAGEDGSGNPILSCLEIATAKCTVFEDPPEENMTHASLTLGGDGNIYYQCSKTQDIHCYQPGNSRSESLFSQKDLEKVCEAVSPKIDGAPVYNGITQVDALFWQDNKLYIQIQCEWRQGEKEWDRYVMLSADRTGTEPELVYEQKLTECMWDNSVEMDAELVEEEGTEHYNWNSGRCLLMAEGKMLFLLNTKKAATQQLACYDYQKGEFTWLDKTKKEYYLPYYYFKEPFGEDDWILEESYMHLMPAELGD